MDLRSSKGARLYYNFIDSWLISPVQRFSLGPNSLTYLGMILAALVPLGFCLSPWFGFVLIILSGLADNLDGHLARKMGLQSLYGKFLDSSVDRVSDFFYLIGFMTLFWLSDERGLLFVFLFFLALLLTFMISYTKAKIESLGQECSTGFMDRFVRVAYFLLWALVLSICPGLEKEILWIGLIVYLILTLTTVSQRILQARRVLP